MIKTVAIDQATHKELRKIAAELGYTIRDVISILIESYKKSMEEK